MAGTWVLCGGVGARVWVRSSFASRAPPPAFVGQLLFYYRVFMASFLVRRLYPDAITITSWEGVNSAFAWMHARVRAPRGQAEHVAAGQDHEFVKAAVSTCTHASELRAGTLSMS